MQNISLLSLLYLMRIATQAEELVAPQTWPSPDKRFTIRHGASDDLRSGIGGEQMYLTAYTLCSTESGVLWAGTSWCDNSAHSFRCIWAENSGAALILDRPQRASIEACLVLTDVPSKGVVLNVQGIIDRVLSEAGDTDDRHLQKAWFGEWRYENGRFHGIVMVARARHYRLHCSVNPTEPKPILHLLDKSALDKWSDAFERL